MHSFLDSKVCDFMNRSGVVIAPRTNLGDAERLFERYDFNCLPVVEGGKLVGVLTKLDFLKAFGFSVNHPIPHYRELMEQPVDGVMTKEPVTFAPDAPLTRVLQRMITTRYKSFPVVDDGRLVGMISRGDVVRALHETTRREEERATA